MEIQRQAVERFLADRLGGEIEGLERLQGGDWSQAFGFHCAGADLVVRFGPYVEDFLKDRAAARFSSADLPIPEVREIGAGLGGHYCVSRRVFGEMLDALDAPRMERAVPAVLRALDALREGDFNVWFGELGLPATGWAEQLLSVDEETKRVGGWHDRMAASPTASEPYDTALAYLKAHIASCHEGSHVVHNDLLHFNVLLRHDAMVGVIDWGNAIRGDFLYDLAMFTFYAPWYPSMQGIDWRGRARDHYRMLGLEVPELDQRLLCYEVHLGLSGMAYSAFKGNWAELHANARRTMELFRA